MSASSMYDEIVPFFGDAKAKLFVALNYNDGDNYSHAINDASNPDTLLDEPLWQLMAAKNYVNGGRADWQKALGGDKVHDLEIAGQFLNFIADIAKHHAHIDGVFTVSEISDLETRGEKRSEVRRKDVIQPTGNNSTDQSRALYNQIYTNFASLDESTRQFYSQHLNIVDMINNVIARQTPGTPARLNLLKEDPRNNMSTVKFQNTLPLLPKGAFFINRDGSQNRTEATLLRDHYRDVYKGEGGLAGRLQKGGAGLADYYADWAAVGLDVAKFAAALVYTTNKKVQDQASGKVAGDLDGVYDLVTGNLYSVGPNGELMKGNKVVDARSYAEDVAAGNVNCHGTELEACDNVWECLLSGDSKKLGRCLGKLRKADMKLVAGKEFKDIRPEAALKLLKTFNIELKKDSYGNRVPMEFLEWRATLDARVGTAAAEAIKQNAQLMEYLRAVVQLVRSNPEIIDENRSKAAQQRAVAAQSDLKLPRPFVAPSKRAAPASSMLLRTVPFVTQQLSLPQPSMLPPGLAGFGYGPVAGLPFGFMPGMGMRGGGDELTETAQLLNNNFAAILKDLQSSGKDLVDADKQLIENAIKKVSKNQKQIEHALNELKAFNKLSTTLKAGLPQALNLKDVDGASRMVNIDSNVSNLQSNVGSLARENQALITQLYNNVFKALASLRLGVQSSSLVPVGN
jgi:hypothetical protein